MIASSSNGDPDREAELPSIFTRVGVGGLLVAPSSEVSAELERLAADGLPIVLLDWDAEGNRLDRVALDNHGSAYRATRLLIENGHRRIAFVGGPELVSSAQQRLAGYRDALASARLLEFANIRSGPYTQEAGRAAALDLLSEIHLPEAIFSGGVLLTLGVLQALRERHMRLTEDIALVGYGDTRWASLVVPPLTVIEQPVEQLGEMAVKLLLSGRSGRAVWQRVLLESRLVVRESHWRSAQAAGQSANLISHIV
jgi:DNA-binding LacI/PurR family transcriptional regulator